MSTEQQSSGKIRVDFKQAMSMLLPYVGNKVLQQIKSVSLIVIYLVLFQRLILGIPISEGLVIALGIGTVIFGLAFFLEGLMLGLMPLGEVCGVKLPQKTKLHVILIFAFILGLGATFAEPAIGVLKAAGSSVKPWEAPLLFLLLNRYSMYLVSAVGVGVGVAVLFGMLRFLYKWSLKPFIYTLYGILLALSLYAFFNKNLLLLTGLAWDCGGVTTGPVTVPLVLALGIGISRIVGGDEAGNSGGFGVVTLASAFPIIAVLILGIVFVGRVPQPMDESAFLAEANRKDAVYILGSEESLKEHTIKAASPSGVLTYFKGSIEEYRKAILAVFDDKEAITRVFGSQTELLKWLDKNENGELKQLYVSKYPQAHLATPAAAGVNAGQVAKRNVLAAVQAILPLSAFLIMVLLFVLREKLPRRDEILLGIFLSIIGMALFSAGIELGLSKLGNQVGGKLPSSFKTIYLEDQQKTIHDFDEELVYTALNSEGEREKFFYSADGTRIRAISFIEDNYDTERGVYLHTPARGPLFGKEGGLAGIIVVIIFAFIMGYGATLAEPALNALGVTVEELTVGTFRKSLLMQAVALGVGIGISVGVAKIIWSIPLIWMLLPSYLILMAVTVMSNEDFVNIGWDSAGVTTGPVTVPLVLAMGLGIGGQIGVVEGFGILASASVFPILSVLAVGLFINKKRKKVLAESQETK